MYLFLMNSFCYLCNQRVRRVCKHPECDHPSIFCSGPCVKGISQTLHTHGGVKNFICFEELQERVSEIKGKKNPNFIHQEYLQQLKKKALLAKDQIDNMVNIIENDLLNVIKPRGLREEVEAILGKIDQNIEVSGKQVSVLFNSDMILRGEQRGTDLFIEGIKQKADEYLEQIIEISSSYVPYHQIFERSKMLFQQGEVLRIQNKLKEALEKYKLARQVNKFDHLIHCRIGYCLIELKLFDQSNESSKECLRLNPLDTSALNNIGVVFFRKKNYQQAIKWFSQAIKINKTYHLYFRNRGNSFFNLKRYEQAIQDYRQVLKLNPDEKLYADKIEKTAKLIKK